ncbi:MAG: hypothetical protein QMB03_08560, partial [Spirosomataceae bacterium]
MKPIPILISLLALISSLSSGQAYFSTGMKIGEVSDTSAIIQTRLCAIETPIAISHERKAPPMRHPIGFDNDMPLAEMDGAVLGQSGKVRVT